MSGGTEGQERGGRRGVAGAFAPPALSALDSTAATSFSVLGGIMPSPMEAGSPSRSWSGGRGARFTASGDSGADGVAAFTAAAGSSGLGSPGGGFFGAGAKEKPPRVLPTEHISTLKSASQVDWSQGGGAGLAPSWGSRGDSTINNLRSTNDVFTGRQLEMQRQIDGMQEQIRQQQQQLMMMRSQQAGPLDLQTQVRVSSTVVES